MYESHLKSILK